MGVGHSTKRIPSGAPFPPTNDPLAPLQNDIRCSHPARAAQNLPSPVIVNRQNYTYNALTGRNPIFDSLWTSSLKLNRQFSGNRNSAPICIISFFLVKIKLMMIINMCTYIYLQTKIIYNQKNFDSNCVLITF